MYYSAGKVCLNAIHGFNDDIVQTAVVVELKCDQFNLNEIQLLSVVTSNSANLSASPSETVAVNICEYRLTLGLPLPCAVLTTRKETANSSLRDQHHLKVHQWHQWRQVVLSSPQVMNQPLNQTLSCPACPVCNTTCVGK